VSISNCDCTAKYTRKCKQNETENVIRIEQNIDMSVEQWSNALQSLSHCRSKWKQNVTQNAIRIEQKIDKSVVQ
jgi:hypothetical protein